ncbi:unnamed protein product, partial [Ectocarpus sp. 8 AP-2014]
MLAVAGRAAADVESVRRALVVAEEKMVGMQAEVDEAVQETDRLAAENAALEESLCEVADAMSKSLPTRDRVPLAETGPDSVSPAPTNSPLETPHHRLPGEEEEGFESAGVSNAAAIARESLPDDASTTAKTPTPTAARVSANLEAARADALARTNAYLRGLLDNLVVANGGGDGGGGFSAEYSNPAATLREQEEEAGGDYDGDGGADEGGHRHDFNGSVENPRRRRGNSRRDSSRFVGVQQQHEAVS